MPSTRAISPTTTSATRTLTPCPAPRNLTTYIPRSSASTSPGREPPSRSGTANRVAVTVSSTGHSRPPAGVWPPIHAVWSACCPDDDLPTTTSAPCSALPTRGDWHGSTPRSSGGASTPTRRTGRPSRRTRARSTSASSSSASTPRRPGGPAGGAADADAPRHRGLRSRCRCGRRPAARRARRGAPAAARRARHHRPSGHPSASTWGPPRRRRRHLGERRTSRAISPSNRISHSGHPRVKFHVVAPVAPSHRNAPLVRVAELADALA